MATIELPATTEVDARNRAARTFFQGLAIDIVTAAVIVMLPLLSSVEWTPAYWAALGLAVAKSALTAVVSYVARKVAAPGVGSPTGEDLADDADERPAHVSWPARENL